MDAPPEKLSSDGFSNAIMTHIEHYYQPEGDGKLVCRQCGGEIQQTTCYASVHDTLFTAICTGPGNVLQIPLPYCPACEGKPEKVYTCIHFELTANNYKDIEVENVED